MNLQPHKGTRLVAGIALVALVSSACVKSDPPGVALVEVKTSAKFGFEEKEKKLADFEAPEDIPLEGAAPLPELPVSSFSSFVRNPPPRLMVTNPDCPEALAEAFPKVPASAQVRGMPQEGTYKWKREVVLRVNRALTPPAFIEQNKLETRYIRAVTRVSANEFRFQTVAPDAATPNLIATSYTVNTNPALVVNQRVDARTIGVVDTPGADIRVPPPQDMPGIYITKIETRDSKNLPLFAFSPLRPMLVAPLEEGIIRTGQTFTSFGIDPTTGDVLRNEGTVGRTSRLDACGEIVEGYAVALKQTYTRDINTSDAATEAQKFQARQLTRNLTLVFATQYGAQPIADSLQIGEISDKTALLARRNIGGLDVQPLPPSLK